ncbi:MAG: hypothetical protein LBF22_00005 [Deltaproteobacteria bacterium]|jgi:hypothetical protein|nr:hypothetical protein [Deltaproteobacteria bacterium]
MSNKNEKNNVSTKEATKEVAKEATKEPTMKFGIIQEIKTSLINLFFSLILINPNLFLHRMGITNNGVPFTKMHIEFIEDKIFPGVKHFTFKYWKGDEKKDELNLLIIEFVDNYNIQTATKHLEHIIDTICKNLEKNVKLRVHFALILEPKVARKSLNIASMTFPGLNKEIFVLKEVDVDSYLSLIQKLSESCAQFDPLHFHYLSRIPAVGKSFRPEILEKVFVLFYNKNIIIEECREDAIDGIIDLYCNRYSLKQREKFWRKEPMQTYMSKIRENERQKGFQEAQIKIEEEKARIAIEMLKDKIEHSRILQILNVTEEWLKKVE